MVGPVPLEGFVDPTPAGLGEEVLLDEARDDPWETRCPKCNKVSLRDYVGVLLADLHVLGWKPGDYR